jgi:hypothetical protein
VKVMTAEMEARQDLQAAVVVAQLAQAVQVN